MDTETKISYFCFTSLKQKMAVSWITFLALAISAAAVSDAGTLCTRAEIAEDNLRKLALANNEMALNIHIQLARSSGNVFFSPLSLSSAFGMLYYGTRGQSAKELRRALGYDSAGLPEELVHTTFNQYLTESLPSSDPSAYVLNSANAALLDKDLNVLPSYREEVRDLYRASVKEVDFATRAAEVAEEVNEWVREKTNGKIEKLLDELDPSTAMVLLNAVYFKGTWKTQFDKEDTGPGVFFNNGQESELKRVEMMRMMEARLPYADLDIAQALELPYKGENISMLILLPKDINGMKTVEDHLMSFESVSAIRSKLRKTKIDLTLPKFKLEYSKEMSDEFQYLGARSIFAPGADFSGMTSSKNLYVTQVLHKAVIEVNEEGSEAAGVTGIISNRMGNLDDEFLVNHPFMFAIVDKRYETILFLGRVMNL